MLPTESAPPRGSKRIAGLAGRLPFFYGWIMLPISLAAVVATAPGQTYGISLFNPSLREALSLSHSQLTGAYMLGTLLAAFPQPWIGRLMDRFGIRRLMAVIVILFGLACIFMASARSLVMLFLAFFLLRLLGQGALALLATNTLAMWFRNRLGFVSGLMSMGMSASIAILPAGVLALIARFGWRTTYLLLGVGVWLLLLPLLAFLFSNRPEDVGQAVDGGAGEIARRGTRPSGEIALDLAAARRTRAYWIMLAASACWSMILTAVFFNIIPVFVSQGLTEADVAATYTTLALVGAGMQFVGGVLADRLPLPWMLSGSLISLAGGIFFLMRADTVWLAHGYAIMVGVTQGLFGAVGNVLWVRYYGRTHLGQIRGSVWTAIVAGSSAGPFVMGFTYDRLGSYRWSLWLFIALLVPLAVFAFWATPPRAEGMPAGVEGLRSSSQ